MAQFFDANLAQRSLTEVLDADKYLSKRFIYPRIWQFHITEKRIIKDLDSITLANIDFGKKIIVMFHRHAQSKVITMQLMEWIIMRIGARFILSKEIYWGISNNPRVGRREFEISINIPVVKI